MADNSRIIVLGLDGVPHTLITSYIKKGLMPNLAELTQTGTLSQMDTVLPEISSVAWSSFMTGKNPAKTGVYGFFDFKPGSYDMHFSNFLNLKEPPLWYIIYKELRNSSVVINMPSTYPAKPIHGLLISGFVAPDIRKAVYPQSFYRQLETMNYQIDIDIPRIRGDKRLLLQEANNLLEKRKEIVEQLWDDINWQLFTVVITGTDRLLHFLMDSFDNPESEFYSEFENYFKMVDEFIGYIRRKASPDDLLLILSDHGFEKIKQEVYLNSYLKQEGFLENTAGPFNDFKNLTGQTKCFNLDPGRIYLHRNSRYPAGFKSEETDLNKLKDDIQQLLLNLKSPDGNQVIRQVLSKEDIYNGKYIDYAPDLILIPETGYSLKGSLASAYVFEDPTKHTGFHNHHDAFMACNYKLDINKKPHILDLTPTLLSHLGINTERYNFDGCTFSIST